MATGIMAVPDGMIAYTEESDCQIVTCAAVLASLELIEDCALPMLQPCTVKRIAPVLGPLHVIFLIFNIPTLSKEYMELADPACSPVVTVTRFVAPTPCGKDAVIEV